MKLLPEAKLLEFLRQQLPDARRLTIEHLAPILGGLSHDTYRLVMSYRIDGTDVTRNLVIRREPESGPLAPYDIARESRVLKALEESDVPVPKVVWTQPAGADLGSPFFIMEEVEGEAMPFFWRLGQPADRRVVNHARMLRKIHEVDWRAHGLSFLGDAAANPINAEIERCRQRAVFHGVETAPLFEEMADWLTEYRPHPLATSLLHGDPNPANYIFRGDDVAAVVDWEMASLGDPRTDIGFYAAPQTLFGGDWGVPYREFAALYQDEAGISLDDMPFFEALGLFRMAVVLLGVQGSSEWDAGEAQARVEGRFREVCETRRKIPTEG